MYRVNRYGRRSRRQYRPGKAEWQISAPLPVRYGDCRMRSGSIRSGWRWSGNESEGWFDDKRTFRFPRVYDPEKTRRRPEGENSAVGTARKNSFPESFLRRSLSRISESDRPKSPVRSSQAD